MNWDEPYDLSRASSSANSDLPDYGGVSLSMGDKKQPEVIVLDDDSPVELEPNHDEISCKNDVLLVFPDICPDYLTQLALLHNYKAEAVISAILDKQEKNENYPTQPDLELRSRKRKRISGCSDPGHGLDRDSDEEGEGSDLESVRSIKLQIATREHAANMASPEYAALARTLISQDFPRVPKIAIRNLLLENNMSVFETYTAMDEKLRSCNDVDMPWKEKKTSSRTVLDFTADKLSSLDLGSYKTSERAAFAEFIAARKLRATKDAKIAAEAEEKNNFVRAQMDGQTNECGICFEECALNRMIRCEGETMHWFCRTCLRSQAESQIGMAKYELTCMSLDSCLAGFSREQRALFLDKKLTVALDRIEQEAILRLAGIENLETCPFCPYAAEYPPVEVDKEFRCDNPRCRQVSCRLCRKGTHIPKTCAEVDADRGLNAQHMLEEARSEALIRRCNKCQNPFVKQDGCNKIRCTKCGTLQCDVCRKTITDYSHFNDLRRGGKAGQCPLFDASQDRYEKEVSSAEEEMRKKVAEENPEVDVGALHIPICKNTQQSDDKIKKGVLGHRPFLERPWGDAWQIFAERPRGILGPHPGHVAPNALQIPDHLAGAGNNNLGPPAFAMLGAVQPEQRPLPNNKMDGLFKAAEDMVQKARKHIERPTPLRMHGFEPHDAIPMPMPMPMPMPVPRLRRLESIINKVENLKKKNTEAIRLGEDAKPPSHPAQLHRSPAIPQPGSQMAQRPNSFQFQVDFPFHPFPGVHRPADNINPLDQSVLDGTGFGMLPMSAPFGDLAMESDDPFLRR